MIAGINYQLFFILLSWYNNIVGDNMKEKSKIEKYVIIFVIIICIILCLRLVYISIENSIRNSKDDYPIFVEDVDKESEDLIFKTKIGDKYIAIKYVDSALGQKCLLRVLESDNGTVWTILSDEFVVNSGYKIGEVNGIIYINNQGIISYGEQNSILLYSDDLGRTFKEAEIEVPDDIFVYELEDVPYFEDNVYKFETTDENGNIIVFESKDGVSKWRLAK